MGCQQIGRTGSLWHWQFFQLTFFFYDCAFLAVVSIGHPWTATDNTTSLIWTVVTLITDSHKSIWSHIWIANDTFSVTWKENCPEKQKVWLCPKLREMCVYLHFLHNLPMAAKEEKKSFILNCMCKRICQNCDKFDWLVGGQRFCPSNSWECVEEGRGKTDNNRTPKHLTHWLVNKLILGYLLCVGTTMTIMMTTWLWLTALILRTIALCQLFAFFHVWNKLYLYLYHLSLEYKPKQKCTTVVFCCTNVDLICMTVH